MTRKDQAMAQDTARCPKPPPGFKLLPSAPLPHKPHRRCPQNILQASYAPLFNTAVSAAMGSEGDQAAHATAGRGAVTPSTPRGPWCARRRDERDQLRGGSEGLASRRTGLPVRSLSPSAGARHGPLAGSGTAVSPRRGPARAGKAPQLPSARQPPAPAGSASQGRHYQAPEGQHQR
ncbi:translation initiation factor IF-2-like [Aquila chrysaetos chrysaetos]|uniref:translation initiation factor IF-2-like n=1 Tax=Aquila chrysaetos chrysaetos TaxID=223781 RepID=UPI001177288A|nr:translation initiation factor IF-2-like [Aquila chrysaetos chrysaetos]